MEPTVKDLTVKEYLELLTYKKAVMERKSLYISSCYSDHIYLIEDSEVIHIANRIEAEMPIIERENKKLKLEIEILEKKCEKLNDYIVLFNKITKKPWWKF